MWQSMETAPKNGKHCILAIRVGCWIYTVQGAFMKDNWMNCMDVDTEPLCWMPNIPLPKEFLPKGFN